MDFNNDLSNNVNSEKDAVNSIGINEIDVLSHSLDDINDEATTVEYKKIIEKIQKMYEIQNNINNKMSNIEDQRMLRKEDLVNYSLSNINYIKNTAPNGSSNITFEFKNKQNELTEKHNDLEIAEGRRRSIIKEINEYNQLASDNSNNTIDIDDLYTQGEIPKAYILKKFEEDYNEKLKDNYPVKLKNSKSIFSKIAGMISKKVKSNNEYYNKFENMKVIMDKINVYKESGTVSEINARCSDISNELVKLSEDYKNLAEEFHKQAYPYTKEHEFSGDVHDHTAPSTIFENVKNETNKNNTDMWPKEIVDQEIKKLEEKKKDIVEYNQNQSEKAKYKKYLTDNNITPEQLEKIATNPEFSKVLDMIKKDDYSEVSKISEVVNSTINKEQETQEIKINSSENII